MIASICFVFTQWGLSDSVYTKKIRQNKYVEHKKAFVHVQSQFMNTFDPYSGWIYLEEAKLFEGTWHSTQYTVL